MSKKTLLIFFIGIIFTSSVVFMINLEKNKMVVVENSFKESSVGIPDDPNARMEFERRMLADPRTGMVPDNIREKELAYAKNLPNSKDIKLQKGENVNVLSWTERGPINRGGRTRALGIDVRTQTAPNITIIAGGASGGIYKSTDNGITWVNKLSPDSIHSATCIAQDIRSGHEDTWYVGTGERDSNLLGGGYNSRASLFLGDGIYKSDDNGEHWTLLPNTSNDHPESYSNVFDFVFDVAVNPVTGSVFAAASNTIQISTDGGNNWTTVRGTFSSTAYTDVATTSTGLIYASVQYNVSDPGIALSTDDGSSWNDITPSTWPSTYTRTVIGIAPNNENVVYFWTYTSAGTTKTQLWKYRYPGSGNGVGDANWTDLTANLPAPDSDPSKVSGINVQSAYDMVIRVKPDDSLFVVIGGTNLYRSTDGFSSPVLPTGATGWIGGYALANNVSQYFHHHVDQHALVFLNDSPNVLYSGNDGGVFKTSDVTASTVGWNDLNHSYVTSQFYSIAIDKATGNSDMIAGGMQDNGNYLTFSNDYNTGWTDWGHGGDGGFSAIANIGGGYVAVFLEAQNGWLWRQLYDNSNTIQGDTKIQPSYTGEFAFLNPFVLDPNDNNIMYFAQGDSVLRSNTLLSSPPSWNVLSNATSDSTGDYISAIGISDNVANRLYVGSAKGTVLRLDGANTGDPTATDLTSTLATAGSSSSGGYVNCIYVDPANADNVIVVYSNYKVISLFSSTDGGTSWTNIGGNLEQNSDGSGDGPSVRWIDAVTTGGTTTYYAATSTGLYSTNNISNGPTTQWAQEGASTIGNVVCPMVAARSSDGLVVVATHGSGVYSANQSLVGVESETSNIPTSYTLNQNYPNPFNPSTKINFTLPSPNNVKITVYDITGKKVGEILNEELAAGSHTVNFNATNLASGAYIYQIRAGNFVEAKKMVLLK